MAATIRRRYGARFDLVTIFVMTPYQFLARLTALIAMIENLGGGQFAPSQALIASFTGSLFDMEVGDLDGDGDGDLIFAIQHFQRTFMVSENLGSGNYGAPVFYSVEGRSASDAVLADMDMDGDLDVVLALDFNDGYRWQENRWGDLSTSHVIDTGVGSWSVEVADLDLDGDLDLVCVDESGGRLTWYRNEGGAFSDPQLINAFTGSVWSAALADFDGDGRVDVGNAVAQQGGRVSTYRNMFPRFEAFCSPAIQHSGGAAAELFATGSSSLAANDVTLVASKLPPGSLTVFLVGRSRGFFPGARGSDGVLCIGGPLGRFHGPGRVTIADGLGAIYFSIDSMMIPTSIGVFAAQPGETWNFQCWFRDTGAGPGRSNFTRGLEITFE